MFHANHFTNDANIFYTGINVGDIVNQINVI